ncbi:MAG: hypothetical protein UX78_C0021G0011 [Candidatus Amesbacteria bacterium GW2011_GWA2_47_11]|uniref:Uncharacterized protein n=1 Tax=Candidatus Amesbacteria bacterium GW2011_GWA2_47_11 TaxID=1618357 RepID=A0A0G1RDK8_9BACT|nr:MAG: hypothetical protein UX78_C0021G0011 [Candidatus Amesbacteria bacterium GW2011_GWA2_47_11]
MSNVGRTYWGVNDDYISRLDVGDGILEGFLGSEVSALGLEPFAHGLSPDHVTIALPIEGDVVASVAVRENNVIGAPEEVDGFTCATGTACGKVVVVDAVIGIAGELIFTKEIVGITGVVVLGGTVPDGPESAA